MLPFRLQQIKDRLDGKRELSGLSREETDLFEEIEYLQRNEMIQIGLRGYGLQTDPPMETMYLAPAPDRCPACGTKFK